MDWVNGKFVELPLPLECSSCNCKFSKCDYKGEKCKIYGSIPHPVYTSDNRGFPTDNQIVKYACIECEFEFFDNENE